MTGPAPVIDWLLVLNGLASGAWTWAKAETYTGMSRTAIEATIHAARFGGAPWGPRHAELAARIVARYGLQATASASSSALLASLPAILAALAILAAAGGGVYMYRNWGKPSSEPIQAGPAMTEPKAAVPQPGPVPAGLTGFPDVSGSWHSGYGIDREYSQSGNRITWAVDYDWGGSPRHEAAEGTVSDLASGNATIDVMITYTQGSETYKAGYTGSLSVDGSGRATQIVWGNGDVLVRP